MVNVGDVSKFLFFFSKGEFNDDEKVRVQFRSPPLFFEPLLPHAYACNYLIRQGEMKIENFINNFHNHHIHFMKGIFQLID